MANEQQFVFVEEGGAGRAFVAMIFRVFVNYSNPSPSASIRCLFHFVAVLFEFCTKSCFDDHNH